MNVEDTLLAASIRHTIHDANTAVAKLSRLIEQNTPHNIDDGDHAEDLHEAQLTLSYHVEKVFRDTRILAERLGLPLYCAEIAAKRASLPDLAEVKPPGWDWDFHCPPLAAAESLFDS